MTDTTPVTFQVEWALLERMRAYAREHNTTVTDWVGEAVKATLRGEYEALRAERDAARADRVCWRETHNQVAAERDALQEAVRRLTAGYELIHHSDGAIWWRRDGWLHATPAETEAVVAARRALDASPTEGNPE